MPYESNGACNCRLNSSSHLSLLKAGMYLRDNPAALIVSNIQKSIWTINVARRCHEVILNLKGKVVYFLWLDGSRLEPMSQQLAELVKFPSPGCFPLNTTALQRLQSH